MPVLRPSELFIYTNDKHLRKAEIYRKQDKVIKLINN